MLKSAMLFLSSIGLSAVLGPAGAAPLQVLRQQFGGLPFLLMGLGTFAVLWGLKMPALGFVFLVNAILISFLFELRKTKLKSELIYASTVLLTAGCFVAVLTGLQVFNVLDWAYVVSTELLMTISLYPQLANSVSTEELLSQLPSLGLIYLILTLTVTVILEKQLFSTVNEKAPKKPMLSKFKLPDSFIWLLLASLLGAFAKLEMPQLQMLSLNIFNVLLFAYFLQGLAIITRFFQMFKVGRVWRVLWYVLFIFQFFIITSVLGVVDYWLDFRQRFKKRAELLGRKDYKSKLGDS